MKFYVEKKLLKLFDASEVLVASEFLSTLSLNDMKSGVGEILQVHAIDYYLSI